MLQNAYFLAKIGADTAENEQHFAEILSTFRDVTSPYLTDRDQSVRDRLHRRQGPGPIQSGAVRRGVRELARAASLHDVSPAKNWKVHLPTDECLLILQVSLV